MMLAVNRACGSAAFKYLLWFKCCAFDCFCFEKLYGKKWDRPVLFDEVSLYFERITVRSVYRIVLMLEMKNIQ